MALTENEFMTGDYPQTVRLDRLTGFWTYLSGMQHSKDFNPKTVYLIMTAFDKQFPEVRGKK